VRGGRRHIGPYRLVDRLGAGGTDEVWRAVDTRKSREVALELIRPYGADDRREHHPAAAGDGHSGRHLQAA
jgi:serine/threonine protein kinase